MGYEECFNRLSGLLQIEKGLENCGGSEQFYCQTIKSVTEYVPRKIVHLKECLSQGDYEGYIIEVHTLKSNAAVIGAEALAKEAKRLEYAGKEKRYEVVENDTNGLIEKYEQMIEALKVILLETVEWETKNPKEFQSEEDKLQCYDILCEAEDYIKEKQFEDALEELELLDIYEMPEELNKKVLEVREMIAENAYEPAAEKLKEVIETM